MNISLLQIYNSTVEFSTRYSDILYFYCIPPFSVFGIILKLISTHILIRLLKHTKNYGRMYNYMINNEIAAAFLAFLLAFTSLYRCGIYCSLAYNYYSKLFELIFWIYTSNVLQLFMTFLEISFAIDRLLAFSPKERTSMKFRYKMIIMLVLSIIISLPNYLISRSIFPVGTLNGQEVLYAIKNNGLIQSEYWTVGLLVLLLLRGPVLYMTLLIINIVIVIKFKKQQKKRSTLTSKNVFLCNLMCFKSYSYFY